MYESPSTYLWSTEEEKTRCVLCGLYVMEPHVSSVHDQRGGEMYCQKVHEIFASPQSPIWCIFASKMKVHTFDFPFAWIWLCKQCGLILSKRKLTSLFPPFCSMACLKKALTRLGARVLHCCPLVSCSLYSLSLAWLHEITYFCPLQRSMCCEISWIIRTPKTSHNLHCWQCE